MVDSLPKEFNDFRSFVLDENCEDQLLNYIKEYTENSSYTGAFFHELTYGGPSHPDRFDISDVASLSLLSVTLNGRMAKQLTEDSEYTEKLAEELAREPDRDLGDLTFEEAKTLNTKAGLDSAWDRIKKVAGVGSTRTSKLLARKRPRLIPIWDSVIKRVLGLPKTKNYWIHFHTALTAENRALDKRLEELTKKAGVADRYSRIRVLDILAWMYGRDEKHFEDRVLTELDSESDEEE